MDKIKHFKSAHLRNYIRMNKQKTHNPRQLASTKLKDSTVFLSGTQEMETFKNYTIPFFLTQVWSDLNMIKTIDPLVKSLI